MLKDVIEFNLTESLAQLDSSIEEALTRKKNPDTVTEKENPERQTRGLDAQAGDQPYASNCVSSSISYPQPQSSEMCLREGGSMYDFGYVKIPRSLINDSRFSGTSAFYRLVLIHIIANCVYKKTEYNDHGKILVLEPGQMVTTYRKLAEDLGKGFTKSTVERAIKYFVEMKIAGQTVGQRKTVISIIHPETLELIKNDRGTSFGTRAGQERDIKKESKEVKKEKTSKKKAAGAASVGSADADRLCLFFVSRLSEKNPHAKIPENLAAWTKAFDAMIRLDNHGVEAIELVVSHVWDTFYGKNVLSPLKLREKFGECWNYVQELVKAKGIPSNDKDSAENIRLSKAWEAECRNPLPGYGIDATPSCVIFLKPSGGTQIPYNIPTKEFIERCEEHRRKAMKR